MSRYTLPEPLPSAGDADTDPDFDAWSLDELDRFADEHLPDELVAHDADH